MQKYLAQRLILFIPTILIVMVFTFGLVRIIPGDVVLVQLSESPYFTEEDYQALRDQLGLNESWPTQFVKYARGLLRGDLGDSLWYDRPVLRIIGERAVPTLEIAVLAFIIANAVGIVFGVVSAANQDRPADYGLRFLAITGLAVPNFWIATMVIVFGARYFGYVPTLIPIAFTDDPLGNLKQYLVPAMVVAWSSSSTVTRMVRSSLLEVLRQDYIRTARAKGAKERTVLYRHALRNAVLPVVTIQGFQIANLLSGSIIVEIVFGLPGLGRVAFDAVNLRDYTVLQGIILLAAIMVVFANLLVDISYSWLDPRIRYA